MSALNTDESANPTLPAMQQPFQVVTKQTRVTAKADDEEPPQITVQISIKDLEIVLLADARDKDTNALFLKVSAPFAVHLHKIYIHLRQQLKLYGKYTLISTSMNFINTSELSITLFAHVLTFNSING